MIVKELIDVLDKESMEISIEEGGVILGAFDLAILLKRFGKYEVTEVSLALNEVLIISVVKTKEA